MSLCAHNTPRSSRVPKTFSRTSSRGRNVSRNCVWQGPRKRNRIPFFCSMTCRIRWRPRNLVCIRSRSSWLRPKTCRQRRAACIRKRKRNAVRPRRRWRLPVTKPPDRKLPNSWKSASCRASYLLTWASCDARRSPTVSWSDRSASCATATCRKSTKRLSKEAVFTQGAPANRLGGT